MVSTMTKRFDDKERGIDWESRGLPMTVDSSPRPVRSDTGRIQEGPLPDEVKKMLKPGSSVLVHSFYEKVASDDYQLDIEARKKERFSAITGTEPPELNYERVIGFNQYSIYDKGGYLADTFTEETEDRMPVTPILPQQRGNEEKGLKKDKPPSKPPSKPPPMPPPMLIENPPPERQLDDDEFDDLISILDAGDLEKIHPIIEGGLEIEIQACSQLFMMWKGILSPTEAFDQRFDLTFGQAYDLLRDKIPKKLRHFLPKSKDRKPKQTKDEVIISDDVRIKKVKTIDKENKQQRKKNASVSKFIQKWVDSTGKDKLFKNYNQCRAIRFMIDKKMKIAKTHDISDLDRIFE